ncbi:MAG: glucokinase [Henriciella sp.]
MSRMVLVGDIGGTNARFALAHIDANDQLNVTDIAILSGDDFDTFEAVVTAYLDRVGQAAPDQALFAIAGPINGRAVDLTNRDWQIDAQRLEQRLGIGHVTLVNDYAAMARSIPELGVSSFRELHKGKRLDERKPILVAGPGTGLGMATLLPSGEAGWSVLTGEGGHTAFAAQTEREWALVRHLQKTHEFVSSELVLAGMGLDTVHRALCEIDGVPWVKMPPSEIMALAGSGDRICDDICTIRACATMGALGDGTLVNGTRGGVVITGGVAERLYNWMIKPEALARFFKRGPRESYMRDISIRLLLSGEAALIGAAALFKDLEGDK